MEMWVLVCSTCKVEFQHSQISDVGMSHLVRPEKPIIPIGQECVCPNCGIGGMYQSTDLLYRNR
jgi:uncharacterized protein (DUF983 family)